MGLIPGQGTAIPHAMEHLNPCSARTRSVGSGAHVPQLESLCAVDPEAHKLQSPHNTSESVSYKERSHFKQLRSHVLQLRFNAAK